MLFFIFKNIKQSGVKSQIKVKPVEA